MTREERKDLFARSSPYLGGRHITSNGYVAFVFRDRTGKRVVMLEHRMNMENKLGRKLYHREVVHHKNGRTTDNSIENLELMGMGTHRHLHNKDHPWKLMNQLLTRR